MCCNPFHWLLAIIVYNCREGCWNLREGQMGHPTCTVMASYRWLQMAPVTWPTLARAVSIWRCAWPWLCLQPGPVQIWRPGSYPQESNVSNMFLAKLNSFGPIKDESSCLVAPVMPEWWPINCGADGFSFRWVPAWRASWFWMVSGLSMRTGRT